MRRPARLAAVFLALLLLFPAGRADAGEPQVAKARILLIGKDSYEFEVTVAHFDTGWDHFLDRWEIVGPGGKVIGTRMLFHPHIGEDYVTRTLRGVTIPEGTGEVLIRVHDKRHGYGREKLISLPTPEKPDTGWQ